MLSPAPSMAPSNAQLWGQVHSIETAGTVDGPGIRYVLFTAGCPLECQYCHNPDTRHACNGRRMSVSEVLEDIQKYKPYIKTGGVTLSGGEPLMQPEFTKAIFEGCKDMGLHTALDTSGFLGNKASDEYLESVDLVLLDIKSGDEETYSRVTGRKLKPTLDFAQRLEQLKIPLWIRFVQVPGLTDDPENIKKIAEFARGLKNIDRLEILPFHKMGEAKYKALGISYALYDTPSPLPEEVEKTRQIFKSYGLEAI